MNFILFTSTKLIWKKATNLYLVKDNDVAKDDGKMLREMRLHNPFFRHIRDLCFATNILLPTNLGQN